MATSVSITFLGTSSAQPSSTRNVSSCCLNFDGDCYMFDCGEGTQHQLRKSPLKPSKISKIFVTHNHGDHIFGLPGFLCTLSGAISEEEKLTKVIEIFGPTGIRSYIRNSMKMSYSHLGFSIKIHELLREGEKASCSIEGIGENEILGDDIKQNGKGLWDIICDNNVWEWIVAGELEHSVPSLGYVLQEAETPGSLNASLVAPLLMKHKQAFLAQGVKNPMVLMKDIKEGKDIALPDGTFIRPADVVGTPKKGRKLVILGDTSNSDKLLPVAANCDVIVHEATNAKLESDKDKTYEQVEATTIDHGHSTPQMAGAFASKANSKMLILNHFSSRYKGDQELESIAVMKEIEDLAKSTFCSENVIASYDLQTIPILRSN